MIDVVDKPGQALDPALKRLLEQRAAPAPDYLHCATCSAVISERGHAIEVNGQHQHFCTNPHGFEFQVACYREALGCTISGPREHADSWFPGFFWRIASCADCHTHLGWYFDQDDAYFYGLVANRLQG